MDFSQLFEENSDIELSKVFDKLSKTSKNSNKELKNVKQEKESLILQLSESHALIDFLKSENIMLFDIIDTLENKLKEFEDLLKKFSSDNLKSMLCIHSYISNKPDLIVDDLSVFTSHASDSKLDSIVIKLVIVDTACLDNSENSCLNNCVKPKSKDIGTQAHGKFVPTCHNCWKIGHIRPNCYLLKSHRPWIKQDALRKSEIEDSSSSKYVPPHRRHIKGKGNVICKNANHNSAENVKKHSNKRSLPPVITTASRVTSDPNVHSSRLRSRRFKGSFMQELHQAFYLRRHFKLHDINNSLFLPIRVANQRRTNQGPLATMAMKGC
jgi:hypothetical protein